MLDEYYYTYSLLEKEAKQQSNKIYYALSVLASDESTRYKDLDYLLSMESVSNSITRNEKDSDYALISSVSPESTMGDRLLQWIKMAVEKLMAIMKNIYDIILRCIENIRKVINRHNRDKDHDKDLQNIIKINGIPKSVYDRIDTTVNRVIVTDIRPVRIAGINRKFSLSPIKTVVDNVYNDALYYYYTDARFRKSVLEVKSKLGMWIKESAKSTEAFVKGVDKIARENIPKGDLLKHVQPLEMTIPKPSVFALPRTLGIYRSKIDSRDKDAQEQVKECLKWLTEDIRQKNHVKNKSKRSTQTLGEIYKSEYVLDDSLFDQNLSSATKHLQSLSEHKMAIFRNTGDLDIPGVSKLLEIDEKIRKFISVVFGAVTMTNIISHLENNHGSLKNAIYLQKVSMLGSYKDMHLE